jgi:16S rRNA processing protein RimM
VGVHGTRGSVRVKVFGDGPDRLLGAEQVTLGSDGEDPNVVEMEVVSAAPGRSDEVRMAFAGIEDREAASKLRGQLLLVEPGELEPLEEGEYYEFQLVGCRVEGEDGTAIGTVREVWPTGAADVLVVAGEEGGQQLIPTGGDFLREVDLDGRRIVIAVIPGLLDPDSGER